MELLNNYFNLVIETINDLDKKKINQLVLEIQKIKSKKGRIFF